ncbi:biotin carboxylase /acetyl-CoA carboxylase carboxyltransferase subunit alpha [Thalassovita litoralis]|jgi:acetyl/propionyl-CoA carboxylase alpha subunit|uniref:Biotin carboxylase /acetyl-CoA carboxylase carboxyltransferase subunit alpha n=1 Tax=Thalassovita litoralis TaxID=1010611 RepID=A0A521FNH7_9RHOB|nr:biotin carboxylase N-terminal domain-containing protein [Thalassovita litoralis]SMO97699.1 biotin carboxylase /acetyl-CoA carboxylase carboxyltransferase subunit alpha [Thalassovita litoralis]
MYDFLTAPHPIRTVLIANRGEVACRVIATCRRLGLRSVAVWSDADHDAPHVRLADHAVRLGPAPAVDSYLNISALLAAAHACGADAIHPGYGFLSENADFVRACIAEGLIFIGPSPDAVAAMGSKIEARRIARDSGVPVVPGFEARDASDVELADAAARIGYPVMVKASAGGGGRGMRRVERPADLPAALSAARAEAGAAFGDATLFIEKLIQSPRHLEVQVFGDGQGGALHFYERDCSVQRNHQKLIEEAPAPNLSADTRQTLLDAALSLTCAIRYGGAGTVEFILGQGDSQPYFLEMNTRLQVEHPVTELICGVDLVEFQLRQAAGLPLPLTQDQIRPKGHAIEVRLNADRPEQGFLPATGPVLDVIAPPGLRFDRGIEAGTVVGSHYDPMLAKLIAHAPDRDQARLALADGLSGLALPGIATNQAFLRDCLLAPDFAAGQATTDFLTRSFPNGWHPDPAALLWLRGQAALACIAANPGSASPLTRTDGFRSAGRPARVPLHLQDDYGETDLTLTLGPVPQVTYSTGTADLTDPPRHWRDGDTLHIAGRGLTLAAHVTPLAQARMTRAPDTPEGQLTAPLTGRVTQVHVAPGDTVAQGDPLVVMEAMKLVHTLTAPHPGRVTRVACAPGETLPAKTVLVDIDPLS